MIEKVDQESEEYLKWKQGSVPAEEPQESIEPESVRTEILESEVQQSFLTELLKLKMM